MFRKKSKYTEPCNRCGACCASSLCPAAEIAFEGEEAPCRALLFDTDSGEAACGLVALEVVMGIDPIVRKSLGIGCGCSCPDENTTDAEIQAFDSYCYQKMFSGG